LRCERPGFGADAQPEQDPIAGSALINLGEMAQIATVSGHHDDNAKPMGV
jgi:hypothetical protein